MDPADENLKRLVKAARSAPKKGQTVPIPRTPTKKIGSLRETVQAIALTLTWRRWSLLAALLAGLTFLIIYFVQKNEEPAPEQPLIQPERPAKHPSNP